MLKDRVLKNMGIAIIVSLVAFVLLGVCIGCIYVGAVVSLSLIEGIVKGILSIGEILFGCTVGLAVALGALGIGIGGVYSVLSLAIEMLRGVFCNVSKCE